MAVTKIWKVESNFENTVKYTVNPDKTVTYRIETEDGQTFYSLKDVIDYAAAKEKTLDETAVHLKEYITGINCCKDTAFEEMMITKCKYCKTGKILAWHGYQSFKPAEVTPDMAHRIGIELAEKLWGDRFQVVVTTHLDKAHIHNHFVVNSVSFLDGMKFYANRESYFRMRAESDALCREYGLSVVENPKYDGLTRGQYRADSEARYTIAKIMREDIDRMIRTSTSINDFLSRMKQSGYRIDAKGKYVTVFPYGHDRGIRIDRRWGKQYSLDGIAGQIEYNRVHGNRVRNQKAIRYHASNVPYAKYGLRGYQALYTRYMYLLGVLPHGREHSNRQMHFLMREDLLQLDTMRKEMDFLRRNKVESLTGLDREKAKRQIAYDALSDRRKRLRNRIRRAPAEKREELISELNVMNEDIRKLRKEIYYCNDIGRRSLKMSEKIRKVNEINMNYELNREKGGINHGRS